MNRMLFVKLKEALFSVLPVTLIVILLNFTPFVKGIKLTSMSDGITVKVFYCNKCRKFVIDQDNLR